MFIQWLLCQNMLVRRNMLNQVIELCNEACAVQLISYYCMTTLKRMRYILKQSVSYAANCWHHLHFHVLLTSRA